jgi:hypothetical protein
MGNNSGKVDMGIELQNPMAPDSTVIGFQMFCGIGTMFAAIYYAVRAYSSKTGPHLGNGKYMKDYSGHFEVRRNET